MGKKTLVIYKKIIIFVHLWKTFNGLQHHQSDLRHLQEKMKKHIEEMPQLPHIENDTTS